MEIFPMKLIDEMDQIPIAWDNLDFVFYPFKNQIKDV